MKFCKIVEIVDLMLEMMFCAIIDGGFFSYLSTNCSNVAEKDWMLSELNEERFQRRFEKNFPRA